MVRRVVSIVGAAGFLLTTGIDATQRPQVGGRGTPSVSLDEKLSAAVTRGDVPGSSSWPPHVTAFSIREYSARRRSRRSADDCGCAVSHRLDDQGVDLGGGDAAVEQGRFALDDPAEKYLPELANLTVFESFDQSTGVYALRPAANEGHRFGISSPTRPGLDTVHQPDRARLQAARRRKIRGRAAPLRAGRRSGCMARASIGSGRLVETLSGKNLDEYFREHIFAPLGMSDTFYNVPESKQARLVTVHRRQDGRADARSRAAQSAAASRDVVQWRRRIVVDGERLHPLPADAPERRHAGWRADPIAPTRSR